MKHDFDLLDHVVAQLSPEVDYRVAATDCNAYGIHSVALFWSLALSIVINVSHVSIC